MSDVTFSPPDHGPLRVFVLSASLRAASLNARLADLVCVKLDQLGTEVDRASIADFELPPYDGDVEQAEGLPPGAEALRDRLARNDAFVITSPEYNASMPGVLKNAIDWVSRARPQPFHERHGLLLAASPSMVGGNRGLWALRVPFEHLGARIYPDMFSLAQVHSAFDDDGRIGNEQLQERLESTIAAFVDLAEAAKHYPCVKARWVEFLGERPEPVLDRVE